MGRGTSGAVIAPEHDGVGTPADSDQSLVARVRRGDDRAFELLYQRYHRRIHAYVLGMVKDHGRAEDVTQEVFVSALHEWRAPFEARQKNLFWAQVPVEPGVVCGPSCRRVARLACASSYEPNAGGRPPSPAATRPTPWR